jgi:hypothetical protein
MRVRAVIVTAVAVVLLVPNPGFAAPRDRMEPSGQQTTCNLPESNAKSLELLSTY